jgi:hypothetical protein
MKARAGIAAGALAALAALAPTRAAPEGIVCALEGKVHFSPGIRDAYSSGFIGTDDYRTFVKKERLSLPACAGATSAGVPVDPQRAGTLYFGGFYEPFALPGTPVRYAACERVGAAGNATVRVALLGGGFLRWDGEFLALRQGETFSIVLTGGARSAGSTSRFETAQPCAKPLGIRDATLTGALAIETPPSQ